MRLSTTLLDDYRLFRTDNDYFTWDKFLASVKGEFKPTPEMLVGRALHQAWETGECTQVVDGEEIQFNPVTAVSRFGPLWADPGRTCEVKETVEIPTGHGPVTLVGKADALKGSVVQELKVSTKAAQVDRYMEALQWKSYCMIFEAPEVDYIFAQISWDRKRGMWDVRDVSTLPMYAYPKMYEELYRWVGDLIGFLVGNNLDYYISDQRYEDIKRHAKAKRVNEHGGQQVQGG